jgi:hypothetical protein
MKEKLSAAYTTVKNNLPAISFKNIKLPKSTADVEWDNDGQPVFKPKKKKD